MKTKINTIKEIKGLLELNKNKKEIQTKPQWLRNYIYNGRI